ncbi:universal stress protein [bacterium]|nr:universal stress protein [bacterium]
MLKSVLVAYDNSEPARAALQYACYLASLFSGKVYVTHVVEMLGSIPIATAMVPGTMEMMAPVPTLDATEEYEQKMQELRDEADLFMKDACRAVGKWGLACEVRCEAGFPLDKIKGLAESVDLLALGKYGPLDEQPHVGRLAGPVARQIPQPVLLASPGYTKPEELILVYSGGERSHHALTLGAEIATQGNIPLKLITLAETPDDDARIRECASRYLSDHNAPFTHESMKSAEGIETALRNRLAQSPSALVIMAAFKGTRLIEWLAGHPTLSLIRELQNPMILCSH